VASGASEGTGHEAQVQQFAYMWRLMHEAPARTRALHRELTAAPLLAAGYAVDRACTAPWYSLVRQDMEAVLGAGAMPLWNGAVA
jgi:hypothetical protein